MDILYDTNIVNDLFAVRVPKQFKTLKEQLEYSLLDEGYELSGASHADNVLSDKLKDELPDSIKTMLGETGTIIPQEYLVKPKYRDTSLGGNDAINCYPQFHESDDIVHPINDVVGDGSNGLGRVYEEKVDRNQQILWVTFGVPRHTALSTFYRTAIKPELAKLMNSGDAWNAFTVGKLLGTVAGYVATLPLQPFIFMSKLMSGMFKLHATRYFEFKPATPLYYRIVNTQIATLMVNMDLGAQQKNFEEATNAKDNLESLTNQVTIGESKPIEDLEQGDAAAAPLSGIPDLFSTYGFDILHILNKRHTFDSTQNAIDSGTLSTAIDNLVHATKDNDDFEQNIVSGFPSKIIEGFTTGSKASLSFVGFRIEKSTDSSESLSNTTAQPEIANTVNSKVQSIRDMKTSMANFNFVDGAAGDVTNKVINALDGFATGALDSVGISGILGMITGQGLVDYPEFWKDSSFTKSYSFKVPIHAVSGDKVSIAYRYIILLLILSGSLPRATGRNSYTSPFIVRAYTKGMFAIPLGIIDSISIKRGDGEFGWSVDKLPLNIEVSFTIKDLSPSMFLGLGDSKSLVDILGQSTSYSEYLMTLAGMSVKDRLLYSSNIKRRLKILVQLTKTAKFNPMLWGMRFSNNSFIGQAAYALWPISKLPE